MNSNMSNNELEVKRTKLEEFLTTSIKEIVQAPFDMESGVRQLADFVQEFHLEDAIKNGVGTQ